MPGSLLASIVFPEHGSSDPRLLGPGFPDTPFVITQEIRLPPTRVTAEQWAKAEAAIPRLCGCGCGGTIQVFPRHRRRGIPQYLLGHHPAAVITEVQRLAKDGLLSASDAARRLGIGVTTLRRLEGVAYRPVPRHGNRAIRGYSAKVVELVRRYLSSRKKPYARDHGRSKSPE
jgi:hypothetical protein